MLNDVFARCGADDGATVADYDAERLPVVCALVALGQRMGAALADEAPWVDDGRRARSVARPGEGRGYATEEAAPRVAAR